MASSPILSCVFLLLTLVLLSHAQDTTQDVLDAHNAARFAVGVPQMTWDTTLEAYAQNYADQQVGGSCLNLVHSKGRYGENLAGSSGEMSGTEAVKMWVDEQVNYDYDSNTCDAGKMCGHYTQVVWSDSVRLGCGKSRCSDGGTYIICSYDPQGNMEGQKPF